MKRLPRAFFCSSGRELVECFGEHLVSRAIADFVDNILFHLGEGPGISDGRATLGRNTQEAHLASDGHRHPAFLVHLAVQVHLRELFVKIAAGQPAQHRRARVGLVPRSQPGLGVQVKRVHERQPAVGFGSTPVSRRQ